MDQKYEVQKGRTVTCKMGVAHADAILTLKNFSGNNEEVKKKIIASLVKIGALKIVPLTDAEKEALIEFKKDESARIEKEAKTVAAAEKEASEKAEAETKAKTDKEDAIISADFDSMKKDPMIEFAKKYEIELKSTLADDIRAELKALQESLTAPK